jgi:putative aldouronate transport system substrate-binding protein
MKGSAAAVAASTAWSAPQVISARSQTPAAETIEVSWATWVAGPVDEDNLARQTILERFNIDLRMLGFERATWVDQINTRVGGGDVPDIIYRESSSQLKTYVEQGVLREVPYDAIRETSPNQFAAANEFSTDVWLATWDGGKNYGIPYLQPNQLHPFTDGWRQDYLDTLGIGKMPETIEEFGEAYTRIASESPGGGLNYGFTLRGKDSLPITIHQYCMAYGANPMMWMQLDDGSFQHGAVMDGTRSALEHLARWYDDGAIDPEFVTTDAAGVTQKWANGTTGYVSSTWYRLIPGGEHYDALKAVSPDAGITMASAPKGPDGQFGYLNWGPITSSVSFSTNVDDTKLARILAMLDTINTDPELATLVRFGIEGEHWARDPETGAALPTAEYLNPANRGSLGTNFFAAQPAVPAIQADHARSDEPELFKHAEAGNVTNFVPFAAYLVPSEVYEEATELDPTRDKWLTDFITGAKSLDDWDEYVATWNEAGGSALTESTNETFVELDQVREGIKAAVGA